MKNNSTRKRMALEMSNLVMDVLDRTGLTIIALSAKMDVDERSIRRWRDGEAIPNLPNYEKLRGLLTKGGDDDSPPYYFVFLTGHVCRAIWFFPWYYSTIKIKMQRRKDYG